jgi:anti-sigma factor RsiW
MRENDAIRDRGPDDGEHVGERLDAYRTGELDDETRQRVEAHLEACGRCRQELAALGAWAGVVERGYEARRTQAAALAPDWAGQRSAIVARTSGRGAAERRSFGRWAPQVALVALAALIVGIVWRENPREREVLTRSTSTRSAEEVAAGAGRDPVAAGDADAAADAARGQSAEALGPPLSPPAATPERARREARPAEAGQQVPAAVERRAENQEEFADRADEPSLAAPLSEVERFERQARAALLARDSAAARRALALWSDTLAAEGDSLAVGADMVQAAPAAAPVLADSLREFLERAE